MASGTAAASSEEEFNEMSAYNDEDTETNVDDDEGYGPLSFRISSSDSQATETTPEYATVDIYEPSDPQSYCLNTDWSWDETPQLILTSSDVVVGKTTVKYYFTGVGNAIGLTTEKSSSGISLSEATVKEGNQYNMDLDLNKDAIVEYFEENTNTRLEFKLNINVIADTGDTVASGTPGVTTSSSSTKTIESEEIDVYITRCGN